MNEIENEIAYETAVAAAYRAHAHWAASKPPKGSALSSLRAWDRLGSEARTLARLAGAQAPRRDDGACPYTVGKRVCVAGPAGHSGAHDWPKA